MAHERIHVELVCEESGYLLSQPNKRERRLCLSPECAEMKTEETEQLIVQTVCAKTKERLERRRLSLEDRLVDLWGASVAVSVGKA